MMPGGELKRYVVNSIWLFAEQALRLIAGFLVGVYVARYLGPTQFGTLSYSLAFVALFGAVARLGLDAVVIRELIANPERRSVLLGTAFWLKVAGALVALLLIAVSIGLASTPENVRVYVIVIGCGLAMQAFDVVDLDFQARSLPKYAAICRMYQLAISSSVKLVLVATQAELWAFVAVSLLDQLVLAAAFVIAMRRMEGVARFFRRFDMEAARQLFSAAAPLAVAALMVAVYMRVDQLLIMELLGVRAVGIYAAASNLTEALYIVPTVVASSFFPAILYARPSATLYQARLSSLYKATLGFGVASALLVSAGSDMIVRLLYGPQFAEAAPVLAVHVWTLIVVCLSAVLGKWLVAEALQSLVPRMTLVAMIVNIAMILVLVPAFGLVGAAAAACVAQIVPALLFLSLDARLRAHLRGALLPAANRP